MTFLNGSIADLINAIAICRIISVPYQQAHFVVHRRALGTFAGITWFLWLPPRIHRLANFGGVMTSKLIRLVGAGALSLVGTLALSSSAAAANTVPMNDAHGGAQQRLESVFETPTSVMTNEVGSITGTLRLSTEMTDQNFATIRIQYDKADEWYTVTGGAFSVSDVDCEQTLHNAAVDWLSRGNTDVTDLSVDCAKSLAGPDDSESTQVSDPDFTYRTDHVVPEKGVQIADGNIMRKCVNIGTNIDDSKRQASVYAQFCTQNRWYPLPVNTFLFADSANPEQFHQAVVDWLKVHDRLDDFVLPGFERE